MDETANLIKKKITEGHAQIEDAYMKILQSVDNELQKLLDKSNELKRTIATYQSDSEKIAADIKTLTENQATLKEKETEVETRLQSVKKRESQVADMQKIQENRQSMLDEKEQELQTKARRTPLYPTTN